MRLGRIIRHRLRSVFHRSRAESEMQRELGLHFDQLVEEFKASGMSDAEARLAARREFGPLEATKELCRDARGVNVMDNFIRDLRYAARTLARSPGFTVAALLALALGIGANTAMYSIVHAVMLRPLAVREPDRLVRVAESNPGMNRPTWSVSLLNYLSWKEARGVELAAFQGYPVTWNADGAPERLEGVAATSSFPSVAGTTVPLGRWFLDEEQRAGRHGVVVLSERLWKARFARDRGVLGRNLVLNGEPHTVVGVASEAPAIPVSPDLWVPLTVDPNGNRANRQYTVIGRLQPEFSVRRAQEELASIARGLEQQFPESNQGWTVSVVPLLHWLVPAATRTALLVLLTAVGMVLLIACTNVANLQLARAEARRKEIAIRSALGAGASRISRQLLTENLLLSIMGGALGVALGSGIVGAARRSLEGIMPRANQISIDLPVLGFALGISVLTGLLFGMAPILKLGKTPSLDALHQQGRTAQPATRSRLRTLLVLAQLSLVTMLLIGAGLLLQSFARLRNVPLGLDTDSVLTARVSLPRARYADGPEISALFLRLSEALESAPGVRSAGVASAIPLGAGSATSGIVAAVTPSVPSAAEPMSAGWRSVDAGFFETLGIPLLRGRLFDSQQDSDQRRVFVISRQAARNLYGAADPIGQQVRLNDTIGEVIGVVGDIHTNSAADPPGNIVYLPISQGGRFGTFALFVGTRNGSPETAATLIRERLREIDSALAAYGFRTMRSWVDADSALPRIRASVLALLAAAALALGMIGIYGVLSYVVALRRQEFGVLLALGAQPGSLLRLVLRQGLALASAGISIGLAGALALSRVLETLLFGVSSRDPMTFLAVAVLLLVAVLMACYVPARRAAGSDPVTALRGC